jgi:methionyl-tRNA formyltransferase
MNPEELNIIYMGTPAFAVEPLKSIINNGYKVSAVVTSPDKPSGRGCKLKFSDVKNFALDNNIPVLQPLNLKDPDFINKLKNIKPDLFIVVAFRMLPEEVWEIPKLGTFNLHASLLPDYRGAAPINHAIINGETKTGLTTFFIDKEIDTGNIILQEECLIEEFDNAGSLHDKLMMKGGNLIIKTIDIINKGTINPISQNSLIKSEIKLAPKINKEFCKIDFNLSCIKVHNFMRGLSPYPAAWCNINEIADSIKIFKSTYSIEKHSYATGKLLTDNKNFIKIAVTDGYIIIDELQLSGKKRMSVKEFLNGYNFSSEALCS